jgi:hypothetical protein
MYTWSALIFFAAEVLAQTGSGNPPLPTNRDNGDMGGIFGIGASASIGTIPPNVLGGLMATGSESPKTGFTPVQEVAGGTGPYKAAYAADPTLPNHTIYAPKAPPEGIKMPVMVFGNGLCLNMGNMYPNLLTEIASYGYLVIANGPPKGGSGYAKVTQMTESIDWAMKEEGTKKYGTIDTQKIAVSGQSCGGLEAYSASKYIPHLNG